MADADEVRSRRLHAERADLISWLAGAVAHDVNNVLSAIAGYAELIEADLDVDDPHAADTAGIREAVLRAGGLVRRLITVGRRQTLRLETLDAVELVEGLIPLLGSACGDRVRIVLDADPEPAVVTADRSLLEQALLNLAVNARDAMPDGGTLTIGVSSGSPPATRSPTAASDPAPKPTPAPGGAGDVREVRISVADTGVGIDAAVLPNVFQPFFSTKGSTRGYGIGLTSVEEAAIRCGGRVSVESSPGTGTCFTIRLPQAAERPIVRATPPPNRRSRRGSETILIVDPDPESRLVLARLLRRLGYAVVDAASTRQATALAERGLDRLDLLATEVTLPDGSGMELAARVRALHPSLPVLFLSRAARSAGGAEHGARPGDSLLAKPFTAENLSAALSSLLDPAVPGTVDR